MRKFFRTLASVAFKAKFSSYWGEERDGFLVEAVNVDLSYNWELDYSIEDSHFPDTRAPFVYVREVTLSFTLLNLNLDLTVEWESEP